MSRYEEYIELVDEKLLVESQLQPLTGTLHLNNTTEDDIFIGVTKQSLTYGLAPAFYTLQAGTQIDITGVYVSGGKLTCFDSDYWPSEVTGDGVDSYSAYPDSASGLLFIITVLTETSSDVTITF